MSASERSYPSDDDVAYREDLLAETREELQRADNKASILLAASGIALSALLAAFAAGTWSPSHLAHNDARICSWISMILALLGLAFIGAAVKPRLRPKETKKERLHYYGDVQGFWPKWYRRHQPAALANARAEFDRALEAASTADNRKRRLDDQIWFLGHIAFRKYRFVTIGLWLFASSILIAALAALCEWL
jgi:MFS family permease